MVGGAECQSQGPFQWRLVWLAIVWEFSFLFFLSFFFTGGFKWAREVVVPKSELWNKKKWDEFLLWFVVFFFLQQRKGKYNKRAGNVCPQISWRGFLSLPCASAWVEERTVSLQEKQARGNAVVIYCVYLLAHMQRHDVIEGNTQTREHWGALICIVMLHCDSQQSLCFVPYHWQCSHLLDRICRVSNPHALTLTLWQHNSATQRSTPARPFSQPRHKVSQLQMFAFSEAQRVRRRSCRCHGRFKRMEQTSRRGRLLAAVPAFDERTPNQ